MKSPLRSACEGRPALTEKRIDTEKEERRASCLKRSSASFCAPVNPNGRLHFRARSSRTLRRVATPAVCAASRGGLGESAAEAGPLGGALIALTPTRRALLTPQTELLRADSLQHVNLHSRFVPSAGAGGRLRLLPLLPPGRADENVAATLPARIWCRYSFYCSSIPLPSHRTFYALSAAPAHCSLPLPFCLPLSVTFFAIFSRVVPQIRPEHVVEQERFAEGAATSSGE